MGDRTIWGVGVKGTPAALSKLTAGVSYWDYRYQSLLGEQEELSQTPAVSGGNKHIGSEADINLTWKHSENVSFNAGVGQFWTGGAIDNLGKNGVLSGGHGAVQADPVTLVSGSMSVKF